MDKARKAALVALDSVLYKGSYSNIALDNTLNAFDLSGKDRSFTSALFYGVLDRKITLDHILSKYLKKDIDKNPGSVVNAMRLALYQIMYMDKVPSSAAVNESVELIKTSKYRYASSLVNGVLRNILRNEPSLPSDNSITSRSVRYSCPEWIIKELSADLGEDATDEILSDTLKTPPVYLRVNTLKTRAEDLVASLEEERISAKTVEDKNAVKLLSGTEISRSSSYKNGLLHVEDLACQRAISHFRVKPGDSVLDMCSAPGGKAFTMAEDMQNKGEIVACDLHLSRLDLISSGAKRLGIDIIKTVQCDSSSHSFDREFDAVLCDVPCSGLGVIRRKPEIKYKEITDYGELEKLQLSILLNADKHLKKGGRLMYSTCTLRTAENNGIVNAFLEKKPSYKLMYEHTFLPHIDKTDGFYCALLEKSR